MVKELIADTPWPVSRAEDLEQIWVPKHLRVDALREIVRDALPSAAMLFGGLCITQGAVLYAVSPQDPSSSMPISLAVGTLLWVVALCLFQFKLPLAAASPAAFLIALVSVGVATLNLYQTAEPLFSGPLFLLLVATAMLFLERRWYLGFSLAAIALWLVVGAEVYSAQEWPYYGLSAVFVVGISAWLFLGRYGTLKRLTHFQLQDQKRKQLLLGQVDDAFKSSAELFELTVRDPLTGAFNRRYLTRLRQELEEDTKLWAAVLIDLDDFKEINDEWGHEAGDRALQKTAHFIRRQGRAEDRLIRYGGDEFLLLLEVQAEDEVTQVARRLRERATAEAPFAFSMGAAFKKPGESLRSLLHRADRAMYHDKQVVHSYERLGIARNWMDDSSSDSSEQPS